MSSKDQNKKQFGQGKNNNQSDKTNQNAGRKGNFNPGNSGRNSQARAGPSAHFTGKKEDQQNKGGNKQSNQNRSNQSQMKNAEGKAKQNKQFVQQNQVEKLATKEVQQNVTQNKTAIKIGFGNTQHLMNSTSKLVSQQAGILPLVLNALSHVSVNFESAQATTTSTTYNKTQIKKPDSQNQSKRNCKNPPKKQINLNNSSTKSDSPVQLRVFSGNQEFNRPTQNFRPRGNVMRSNFQRPPQPMHHFKQSNATSTPRINFMPPNTSHNTQNLYSFIPPQPQQHNKRFGNPYAMHKEKGKNDFSPNTYPNSNSNFTASSFSGNASVKSAAFNYCQNNEQPSSRSGFPNNYNQSNASDQSFKQVKAPVFKSKKNKKACNVLNPIKEQKHISNEFKKNRDKTGQSAYKFSRKRQRNENWKKNKAEQEASATSLFSFQRKLPTTAQAERKNSVSSNEDDASLSRCSSKESIWTTTVSDDALEDSSSDESEVTSDLSTISSIKDSGIASYASDLNVSTVSKEYKVIAYYWDIENCPVPHQKSPTDFVKRVRETFSAGRSEFEFTAVCDVTKLNELIAEELDRASVNMMHISYVNKNAADSKIKSLLQEFPDRCRGSNDSAVVLISGDYDFANTLNNLKYKYMIKVYLICKDNARHSLIEASDEHHFYEDFVKDLPARLTENKKNYLIIVKDFPIALNSKQIKKIINDKVKGINCRVKIKEKTAVVIFPNNSLREKAFSLLKGHNIAGKEIQLSYSEEEISFVLDQLNVKSPEQKNESIKMKYNVNIKGSSVCEENMSENKGAVLYVYVSRELGNINFWKINLEKLWNSNEFKLQWEGEKNEGYFLVHFNSLSKAQKAKKILQKAQKNDPNAPKFLKLIKQDDISMEVNNTSISDINKQKIENQLKAVESKEKSCLNKLDQKLSELKSMSSSPDATEAVKDKYNELNEQKVTFLNFSNNILNEIKKLDVMSDTIDENIDRIMCDYNRECNAFCSFLPIYAKKNFILKKIKKHQVVIIRAETGSGKSTQLSQYVWRNQTSNQNAIVVCTQPRKLAAISLAKHVSMQIGSSLGEIVGYQVGLNSKISSKTGILYMTDITMLKSLISDGLKNVSCIIVDEAHERTIYTDLLLGMIKSYLKVRPDLKLIITSATIDTTIFQRYFQLPDECIIELSGRTFPIEDIWLDQDVLLGWDYFPKVIDKVFDILNDKPEGSILAFLTTPFETEKAITTLTNKLTEKMKENIIIYQLHGKLDIAEQQKVFENSKNKIKVVFATNCAETSVTIPGIKYVVDCGFVKDSQYDAVRNMNVLSVNLVSQSSAQQRRGRAGRTQAGKCFHLYSRSNFENMIKISDPEILRCNLGNALLKLIKIGVKNPLEFDFVQSPAKEDLEFAMKQLIELQAINEDMSLTISGEIISCLPFEPRLGHLVFEGINNDVGFESIVLSALITISRSIFFRTTDNKSEADVKKLRFCQSESDFLTYFDIYKEWSSVPKQAKNKWCVLNCINARSMRTAHDLINEVIPILRKEVNIKVSNSFKAEINNEMLLKIIFRSFYQNLCIYSGYPKFGYKAIGISENLLIHPSSSLYTYGNWRPQFLVYDSILRTDKTFLINVSPVTDNILSECETELEAMLNLEVLETLPLQTYSISPIGKTIILHDIIGKQGIHKKNFESSLKTLIETDSVAIDVDVPKGEIKVYAPQGKEDVVQSIFCPVVSNAQERLLSEEKEVILYSHLHAIVSAGAEIKDVILPGEFRDLKVLLKNQTQISDVVEKLQTCGTVCTVVEFKYYFKITFLHPIEAQSALESFQNNDSFSLQKIVKLNLFDSKAHQYKIITSFTRRRCTGIGFVSIDPPSLALTACSILSLKTLVYKKHLLQFSLSKKSQDIAIKGLPPDADYHEFREFLSSKLPTEYKISKVVVVRQPEFDTAESDLESTKKKLLDLFGKFTQQQDLSLSLKKPAPKDNKWHAILYFKNCQNAETAVSVLKDNSIVDDFIGLDLKLVLETFLYCKLKIFSVVKQQVEEALDYFNSNSTGGKTLNIEVKTKGNDSVQIYITSNNVADIMDARRAILNCLLGDPIHCQGEETLEKLFTKEGKAFLREISNKPDLYLEINTHKKIVTLYGNESICTSTKIEINGYLNKHQDQAEINLMSDKTKPGVLRSLLKTYGPDLKQLRELCGLNGIEIDTRNHILYVSGSISSISKCQDIVVELKANVEPTSPEEDAELCPICLVEIDSNNHRLEYCGHAYCNECILHLFQSSDDYPLHCIVCGIPIVLADFQWACKEAKLSETDIFKKSLQIFVQNRDDICYCPSPDCPMIFRKTDVGENMFHCPSCSNAICIRCEELYHFGMSCSLNKCTKNEDDYSLKEWMQEDPYNRKQCPKCSSPIEKNEGCNHITCWKCKTHMCWMCLEVFSTGSLVYAHMAKCPNHNLIDLF